MVSPELLQTLDHMEHAGELQLRSLKERVDAERVALKETMSLSRAAAVASVQQEEELCKARESAQAMLREHQQKEQQQQRRQVAAQLSCVSPELARGDTEEGVRSEERLLEENQRLAAEVMTLRLRLEEMLTAESRQPIGEEDHRRRVQEPDVVDSGPVGVKQHQAGGEVTDRRGSRTSRKRTIISSNRVKGRATTSPSSCRSKSDKMQDALPYGNDGDSSSSSSDNEQDPEESIREIASKCGADPVIGSSSSGNRRHPQVVRVTHRTSPGSRESMVEVGVGALVGSPSRSSGGVGWSGRSSGGQDDARDSRVCISSNSTSSSDVVRSERVARLVEEEAEEILAKLKARPTPELRALIKARREAELFAAAARVRCGEIERLPAPPLPAAAWPRQSLAAVVAAAAADDQHSPVGGVGLPCWGNFR